MERVTRSTDEHCVDAIATVTADVVSTVTDNNDHNVTVDSSTVADLSSACTDAFQLHRFPLSTFDCMHATVSIPVRDSSRLR